MSENIKLSPFLAMSMKLFPLLLASAYGYEMRKAYIFLYTKCIPVFTMVQTTVITTRIKKEVKEVLERAGINIPAVIKTYLEELAWKLQLSVETEEMRKLLENVKPSEKGFAEKSVREDRESH